MSGSAGLPSDWFSLGGLALVTVGGWVTAWLMRRDQRALHGKVDTVTEQVKNSHKTNLREDVDLVGAGVELGNGLLVSLVRDVGGMREDFGNLRGEVREEFAQLRGEVRADRAYFEQELNRVARGGA